MIGGAALALALDGAWPGRFGAKGAAAPLDAGLTLTAFRASPLDLPDLRPKEKQLPAAIDRAIPSARVRGEMEARKVPGGPLPKAERYTGGPIPLLRWPTDGEITSPFGYRVLRGRFRHHSGLDIRAPHGTPVRAAADGLVVFASWRGGYGALVVIDHGGGVRTWYAHNRSIAVKAGTRVAAGQVIARAGDTGHAYGPHTHFELRLGDVPVDPLRYLEAREEPAFAAAGGDAGEGVGGP